MWTNLIFNIKALVKLCLMARVGLATNFQPTGDPWNPNAYAVCLHRDLRNSDVVVAHPTLPCGSKVFLYVPRTHKACVAAIGDRGPRHAMVDFAPATTRLLRANGWETVIMVPLEN
jgi:hypothetical protein